MNHGLHIVLLGPDGCGKSTLLPLLQERLDAHFTKTALYHWRPKVFADAGVVTGARKASTGPTTDPHGRPPHGILLSLARLSYYVLDYILGSFPIRKAKNAGQLVIFDRYAPDMAVDPRRYRFKLPQSFLWLACRFAPSPDLGFILLTDAEVLYARKREVPLETLRPLLANYRAVAQSNQAYKIIDCGKSPTEVADEIVGRILTHLQERKR
jgi:thymidylate kinase